MKKIDIHQHYYPELDPDAAKVLKGMDEHHIEKALIMACHKDISPFVGDNEDVADMVRRHSDRFIGGVCVKPLAAAQARRTIRKYFDKGFKCVKMFPVYGFYPDDPKCFPVYELIQELDMLLLFHTGGASKSLMTERPPVIPSLKYSRPGYYDTLGHAFPDLKMVLAHFGGGITVYNLAEVISVCTNHKNIYLDISCSTAAAALEIYSKTVDRYVTPLDLNKLVWGSDNINPGNWLKRNLAALEKLTKGNNELLEIIFYRNAHKLLKLIA